MRLLIPVMLKRLILYSDPYLRLKHLDPQKKRTEAKKCDEENYEPAAVYFSFYWALLLVQKLGYSVSENEKSAF